MRTERESAIRLLQLLMVASLVFPAALFAYVSYNDYRERLCRRRRAHRSFARRTRRNRRSRSSRPSTASFPKSARSCAACRTTRSARRRHSLTPRLQRIVGVMPQVQSIVLIGRDGRLLASSTPHAMQADADFAGRDYFKAQADDDVGTYVSDVRTLDDPGQGTDMFDLSRRLPLGRRIVPRRHRGRGAAALLRRFLRDDRAVARQFLCAGAVTTASCWRATRTSPHPLRAAQLGRASCGCRSARASRAACFRSTPRSTAATGASAFASCRAIRSTPLPASTAPQSAPNGLQWSAAI